MKTSKRRVPEITPEEERHFEQVELQEKEVAAVMAAANLALDSALEMAEQAQCEGLVDGDKNDVAGERARKSRKAGAEVLSRAEARLAEADELARVVQERREELEALSKQVERYMRRAERMQKKAAETAERMGNDTALDALQRIPEMVAHAVEEARINTEGIKEEIQHAVERRVQWLTESNMHDVAQVTEEVIASTRERLEHLESDLHEAEKRIQEQVGATLENHRRMMMERIEQYQSRSIELERSLHTQIALHARALKEAERSLRERFEDWFMTAASDYVRPEVDLLRSHLIDVDAEMQARIQEVTQKAETSNGVLLHKFREMERQSRAMARRSGTVPTAIAAVFALLFITTLAFNYSSSQKADSPQPAAVVVRKGTPPAPRQVKAEVLPPAVPQTDSVDAIEPSPAETTPAAAAWVWVVFSSPSAKEAQAHCDMLISRGQIAAHVYSTGAHHRVGIGRFKDSSDARKRARAIKEWLPPDAWLLHVD